MTAKIILASASPRRQELLEQIRVSYEVVVAPVDEAPLPDEDPIAYVQRLAREKTRTVQTMAKAALPILGADTIVVADNQILGKPQDKAHGLAMLRRLSGRSHDVVTAVCLLHSGKLLQALSQSKVYFRSLSENEILAYWETGEPRDKAGAYAIQGLGAIFVQRLEGSFSGVMGLPLYETAQLLRQIGIEVL
ncbi:MAG TPA: septum formation inhibitor Maf [Methylothermaceae bacterium]|nr:septum formation inhibitor Maf [Methylothermaceae bacterium]